MTTSRFELTAQRQKVSTLPTEPPATGVMYKGRWHYFLKKNQNAPRRSEHPSVRGEEMSKRLGGIKGCKKYKTSSWHLNGFPDGNSIDWGILYNSMNRHAGISHKNRRHGKLGLQLNMLHYI